MFLTHTNLISNHPPFKRINQFTHQLFKPSTLQMSTHKFKWYMLHRNFCYKQININCGQDFAPNIFPSTTVKPMCGEHFQDLHITLSLCKHPLMKPGFLIFLFILFLATSYSQKELNIQILTTGTNTSLRGMSVPTETVVWVSGSNGTVGKSTDGGKTWRWLIVTGYEKRDFRDIKAFDSSTAIIMAVDKPAYLLKTVDGGTTWKKVF